MEDIIIKEIENEVKEQGKALKSLRGHMSLNRREFAEHFGIPLRTVEDWEADRRKMPAYLLRLLIYQYKLDAMREAQLKNDKKANNVNIIHDAEGKNIVLINDIRFKGKKKEEWDEVEEYLKEYVGKYYEIAETSEKVYIGKEFPDEFTHAKDKMTLRGANLRAKANASQAVPELIKIATNKSEAPDYKEKHGDKAKFGWYRYDTRLALPVYDDNGELVSYNIFKMRMLVRHDKDGKLYLYDFLWTKKETSSPL